jgi:hypothetical protein
MQVNYYNDELTLRRSVHTPSRRSDSALLFIVFAIGLTGLVYIMHQTVTKSAGTSSYSTPVGDPAASDESIYLTSNR